ncbi:hypothetical protein ACET9K_19950 [Aeromonas enteropelogenes]|uniref:hypothetical protein n=1 Tax=Aeromonas TaxID=642 RepID=UPI001C2194EF|nr:hypothetical protein [Aeromonas sp. FDAARGOS 1403]QXA16570.1 hypothetical protein I6L33_05185 [Aeromonas sp. FDAARGOS 1403]
MKTISKIIAALVAVLGTLSAIKTLVPPEITYSELLQNWLFISGWLVCVILAIVLIYQEERYRAKQEYAHRLLDERSSDKDFFKGEISKTNIILDHLTSRTEWKGRPIPRKKNYEGNDEF